MTCTFFLHIVLLEGQIMCVSIYLYGAHIQPRAAHGALHHIIPGHWTCSFMYHFNSPGSIQHCSHVALVTCRATIAISVPSGTHLHPPEWSEAREGKVPCPRKQHWYHNVPALRGRNMIFLWKSCALRASNSRSRQGHWQSPSTKRLETSTDEISATRVNLQHVIYVRLILTLILLN